MTDPTLLVLRLIHIFAGVFWAGAVFFLIRFLNPALEASGAAGGEVLKHVFLKQKAGIAIPIAAFLTVVAGVWMYWRNYSATSGAWARSTPGMVYGIGGVAAIIAMIAGASMIGPCMQKVVNLSAAIQSEGRAPSADELAAIGRLKAKAAIGLKIAASMLLITIAAMAIGRYV